ncbi:DnaD domain protein [Pseudogracilibacillus sp. SE30717A]|uniref:replication initiation and membrane attachment family protein n=1 Tax=Pseudogracilibacillus sp. SE30717A TaxID=3098293 RepID=UPI00300DD0C8
MNIVHHLGKVLPVDGYRVQLINSLPTDYIQSLTHLYQPLLGIEAISLYQLLLHEIAIQSESQLQTHHTLMNYLNLSLDRIYEARLKLEGIGLLKVYKNETEEKTIYTYVIQPPFSPPSFFQDMMLSELLYRHIGESKFVTLKSHYTDLNKQPVGTNITAAFHDVFQTFKPSNNALSSPTYKEHSPKVPIQQMDFGILKQSLKRKMIPAEKVLTETNKRIISQLVQLYNLESYEIEKSVEWALNEENRLDIEQFKAICLDVFRTKNNVNDIQLSVKQTPQQNLHQSEKSSSLTKTEKLIERFESISPKELLEDLSSGNNASEQDLKFISDLMVSQGLPIPVMNVLIHYVMLRSDMKLPQGYTEKIASNWSRKKFTTAKEAMDFIQQQGESKGTPRQNYRPRKQSNEIIPDWFKERKKQSKNAPEDLLTKEQEREKEEMVTLLQKYASENN